MTLYTGPQTMDYPTIDDHGTRHYVTARRTTYVGLNQHPLPEGRVLELSSPDRPRFRSLHRALARRLGWSVKAYEMTAYTGRAIATVKTYWLPPKDVATDSLELTGGIIPVDGINGMSAYRTPQGHTITAHEARRHGARMIESAYVSVDDVDGRFLLNHPMDSTAEALDEAPYIAMARATNQAY